VSERARSFTALVLAADRRDPRDPLAAASRGGNKCLIDIVGRPMLAWVLDALLQAPEIDDVLVSTDDADLLSRLPEFHDACALGRLRVVPSGPNLFASVEQALTDAARPRCPALVTTGDHPLLTPAMVAYFCREISARDTDAAIAMTRAEVMRAVHPDGQRRFYAFSDGEFSNCNLYAIVSPRAIAAARMFEGGGQFRKNALRILRAFGVLNFLRYRLRLLSLDGLGERLSRVFGARIRMVTMPFAEACIDVDNERTLALAREVLGNRGSGQDTAVTAH
jgi:GTP:adenosylcobinamide-phosphate guanylyltransferase